MGEAFVLEIISKVKTDHQRNDIVGVGCTGRRGLGSSCGDRTF